jgi:hypothetical protein
MQPRAVANLAIGWDVERVDRWTEPSRGSSGIRVFISIGELLSQTGP